MISALSLWGCSDDAGFVDDNGTGSIYLSAVTEKNIETRAPYEYTIPNNTDGVLNASVWASTNYKSFLNTGENGKVDKNGNDVDGKVAIYTSASFDSGNPKLLNQAVYPKSGKTVSFIGLHPQIGWGSDAAGTRATFTFNGSQDVMFAPRIQGKYADPNDLGIVFDVPVLHFKHLLTWLKINIMAENEETVNAWGKIIDMKITSQDNLTVSLDYEESPGYVYTDHVVYATEGDGLLPLYYNGGDNVFPGVNGYTMEYYPDVEKPVKVAYVLCSPVQGVEKTVNAGGVNVTVPEYTLYIETEHRKVTLPIDLKINETSYFTEHSRAKCFTLNLTFMMGNTIVLSAELDELDDWRLGGIGNKEL